MAWTFPDSGKFLAELRRRRVLRVLGFYAISVWIVLQVSNIVFPALLLPVWAMTVLVVAIVASFPLVAILAWVFDITPSGIVRTEPRADGARYDDEPGDVLADRPRMWIDIAIVGVLLAIIGYLLIRPDPFATAGGEASIAVLPFADLSERGDNAYFVDGITAELMDSLVRIPGLQVVAHAASSPTMATLTGSVRRDGDRLRIVAQLIDSRNGVQLWSETYDRTVGDIFAVQDDIARAVVRGLRVRLGSGAGPLVEQATHDIDAYDLYLRGRGFLRDAWLSDNVRQAIDHFERALRIDPRFALANAGLCSAQWELYELVRDQAAVDRAMDACNAARTRDDTLPEIHVALGWLYEGTGNAGLAREHFGRALHLSNGRSTDALRGIGIVQDKAGEHETAEATLRLAIEMEPTYWRNYIYLGRILFHRGRFDDAIGVYRRGIERSPANPYLYNSLGGSYLAAGDWGRAIDAFKTSLEIHPTVHAYRNAGTAYFYLARYEEARSMYEHAVALQPNSYETRSFLADACRQVDGGDECERDNTRTAIELALEHLSVDPGAVDAVARLGLLYARIGEQRTAQRYMADALRRAPANGNVLRQAALVAIMEDDRDGALELLRRARAARYPVHMLDHPEFAKLNSDRRFQALVEIEGGAR